MSNNLSHSTKVFKKSHITFLLLSFSSYISVIIKFIIITYAANSFGPILFGKWTLISTIVSYMPIIHFGILNHYGRILPILSGNGKHITLYKLFINIKSFIIRYSFIIVLFSFAISIYLNDKFYFVAGIVLVSSLVIRFFEVSTKSSERFIQFSRFTLITSILSLISLIIIYFKEFYLFVIYIWVSQVFLIILLYKKISFSNLKQSFDLNNFLYSIRKGFPIMINGFLFTFFYSIDRWFVIDMFGNNKFGLYSLIISFFSFAYIITNTVIEMQYPVLTRKYGNSNLDKNNIKHFFKPFLIIVTISLVISILLLIFSKTIVYLLFPNYIEIISAMQISVCFFPIIPIYLLIVTIFTIFDLQLISLITISFTIILKYFVLKYFHFIETIENFSLLNGCVNLLSLILVSTLLLYYINKKR